MVETNCSGEVMSTASKSKPTLRTIAEATGFAVATVSRALADDPRIAQKTRDRVRKVAGDIGYVPDRAAQRLRTGRTKVISLLINPAHEYLGFTSEIIVGMTEALRGTGYTISILPDLVGDDRLAAIQSLLTHNLADGVVFTRTESFDPRVRLLLERDFPFVSHGRTEFSTPHAFVDFDNEAFARAAVRHAVSQGRQRLCAILPDPKYTFSQHLRYGFMAEVRAAGIDYVIPDFVTLDSDPRGISRAVFELNASENAPDGYMCVGEVSAMATLAALSDSGTTLDDISIMAKRASPVFDLYRPRIASLFEDLQEVGRLLGELLLARINGADPAELGRLQQPIGSFESFSHDP
ncbi:MAG: LacI family transcriptional regulator [Pseudomonadota bacterium]